jgi:hypothetical protein
MITIYADVNDTTEDGKFILSISGSRVDIERHKQMIYPGIRVKFNVQYEFEVQGIMEFEEETNCWLGVPDWDTLVFW